VKAGPKQAVDESRLPWRPRASESESERFERFARKYLRLAGGAPLVLRPWHLDLVASVWDADPRESGCWCFCGTASAVSRSGGCLVALLGALVDRFSSAFLVGAISAVLGLVASRTRTRPNNRNPRSFPH
jgi:hypothetical protein